MKVQRIHTETGSHIEPPFDQHWDKLTQLQWHAAVVEVDSGVRVNVIAGGAREKIFGKWRDIPGQYSYSCGHTSGSSMGFHGMWDFLNGVSLGARMVTS